MGKGQAPTTIQYEVIRIDERKRAYRAAVLKNKRENARKKRNRSKK